MHFPQPLLMLLGLSISLNPAALLWLLVVGLVTAYFAHRQGKKPWLGAIIGVGLTFIALLFLPGLVALVAGLVVGCLIVYMLPE